MMGPDEWEEAAQRHSRMLTDAEYAARVYLLGQVLAMPGRWGKRMRRLTPKENGR